MTLILPTRTKCAMVATFAAAALLVGCGGDDKSADTPAASTSASITVSGPWARTSPAVASAGAVYLVLTNGGGVEDALVAAGVDPSVAKTVELHETAVVGSKDSTAMTATTGMATATSAPGGMQSSTTTGGGAEMMEMRPVARIVVPANGSVALAPGGYHIMLVGLVDPLAVGSTVSVTLTFEKSGNQVVTAPVRDTAP